MERKQRRVLIAALMVMLLAIVATVPVAFAATSQNVVITAQPSWLTISNDPDVWTLNDIVGDGVTAKGYIAVDTIYYANPQGDGTPPTATVEADECQFEVDTTGSSVAVDLSVNCGNFTGITGDMDNSGTGANGATTYGGYSYVVGGSSAGVVMAETGSGVLISDLAIDTTKKWGAWIETRTDAWADDTSGTATMTMSAVQHI